MKTFTALLIGTAAILATTAPADAALVLDQSFQGLGMVSGGIVGGFSNPETFRRVQTVTVGLTGPLARIDIQLDSAIPFGGLRVFSTAAGIPTLNLLQTATYQSYANGYATFTLNLSVVSGQVIAIDPFTTPANTTYIYWDGTAAGGYTRGSGFYSNNSGATYTAETADWGFRTFVDVAVPEPSSWAMMILGIGAVGFAMRRRPKVSTTIKFA